MAVAQRRKGVPNRSHSPQPPRRGTSEQHPAGTPFRGVRFWVLLRSFKNPRIQVRGFVGKQLGADCAVNATILPAVPRCNPGGPVGPSRPTDDAPTRIFSAIGPTCPPFPAMPPVRREGQKAKGSKPPGSEPPRPEALGGPALRARALGIGGTEAHPTEASRAYKRSAKAAHKPSRPANSTRPRPAGLRRAAESSWPAGSPDDRINDRPPGIFHLGRRCTGAWAADGPHRRTALSTWGRFCCARPRHGTRDQP